MTYRVFDEECERLLRENSPRVTAVSLRNSHRPSAERLGEALRGNTHVEELRLWLNGIDEGEDVTLLLQFVGESTILKTLGLLFALERSAARTGRFLQAASGNSTITKIDLGFSCIPVESFTRLMRTTASIANLRLHGVSFTQETAQPDSPSVGEQLTAAFTSNRILKRLNLRTINNNDFKAIVSALKEPTSTVESILLGRLTPVMCESLVQCLPKFRNLRSIRFSLGETSSHLKDRLLSAFRHNGSLTSIQVDAPFLNERDQNLFRLITDRNTRLPPLIKSTPESSGESISLWPGMFEASITMTAEEVGPTHAFAALLGLGERVGDFNVEESSNQSSPKKQNTRR